MVSHGASGQECWGSSTSGGGLVNSCTHSDSNDYSGGNTVWYNYALASAGTIVNESSFYSTENMVTATESICPKGWTLPTTKQVDNNRDVSSFLPVQGGYYANGIPTDVGKYGFWWGSEAYSNVNRYGLNYNGSSLATFNSYLRRTGTYIRCVSEEKTVLDLTYMQDIARGITKTIK